MRRLIITGGSKGIGRATAARFVADGYRATNFSRSPSRLDGVEDIGVDLAVPGYEGAVGRALADAASGATSIVMVHNAALMPHDTAFTVDGDALRRTLEIGLVAPALINGLLIGKMPPGSAILYVGSTLSEKAVPGAASYVTSKHGVVGLMRATCQDLAGKGVHTACICPGFTDTEMLREATGSDEGVLGAIRSMVTFGRLIAPEEIADAIFFAAHAPVMNGAVLHANLGQIER